MIIEDTQEESDLGSNADLGTPEQSLLDEERLASLPVPCEWSAMDPARDPPVTRYSNSQ